MDRRSPYFDQLVSVANVEEWFDDVESGIQRILRDLLFKGVIDGLTVEEQSPKDFTVNVDAGVARDPLGNRCAIASPVNVDLSVDYQSAATAVSGGGNSKILSIFLKFDRLLQNPKTDGNGDSIFYDRLESYKLEVRQGAESASPSAPALLVDGILLADVTITFGQTEIQNSDISIARRQDLVVLTGTPFGTSGTDGRHGSYLDALQAVVDRWNAAVAGSGDVFSGASVNYAGSGATKWADTLGLGAGTMQATFTAIVAALGATASGASNSGGYKIGVEQDTGAASGTLAAGTLDARLKVLRNGTTINYAGSGAWADTNTIAAGSVSSGISAIVSDLAANGGGGSNGANKIGLATTGNFTAGSIFGGFQQLAATTSSNDGAKRIGTEATGGITGATVRAQLDDLQTKKAALAGATFTGDVTAPNFKPTTAATSRAERSLMYSSSLDKWTLPLACALAADGNNAQILNIPHGATLTELTVGTKLQASRAPDALPDTKPELSLFKQNAATGVLSPVIASQSDTTGTNTAYKLAHDITISGLSEVIDNQTYIYWAYVTGESGTNKQAIEINTMRWTANVPTIDQGC